MSIVIPVYNEEDVLPLLAQRLRPVADGLDAAYEVVAVDDGSTDATAVVLQRIRREWPEFRVVRLRANAGHQAAISAGLACARGDYVVTLDADLQDPPEVIPEMLTAAREQRADVVYGVRSDRSSDTAFKRLSARGFYRVIRALSGTRAQSDAGDYRMMSRATVEAINPCPSTTGCCASSCRRWVFLGVGLVQARRARSGPLEVPAGQDARLSIDSVTGFSIAPLRAATWLGLTGGLAAVGLLLYALVAQAVGHTLPAGPRRWSRSHRWARCSCCASASSASTSAGCTP